jgi:FixJ family two-component response regulator
MNNKFDVIIVDDVPEFTKNLRKILEIESINLKVFEEPHEFLNYSMNKEFDSCKILIIDYSMPLLTGYDVYKELYEIKEGHIHQKKILYTANLEQIPIDEKQYIESLGIEFLKKPNIQELIRIILEGMES